MDEVDKTLTETEITEITQRWKKGECYVEDVGALLHSHEQLKEWESRFEIAFGNNVQYIRENKQFEKQIKWFKKQIKDYERVLKWYANSQYYHILDQHGYKAVENDEGEQARETLRRWNEK